MKAMQLTAPRAALKLDQANDALAQLREGRITGAAVLVP
jgi:D-arabinose 1-dehydrogenase-like Zn-dependent alcohol dehydrogenase